MSKYAPTSIPPHADKPVSEMTALEYLSWRGRCGGSSKSKKKLRGQRKGARAKKPGLSRYHELVKQVARDGYTTVAEVMLLGTSDYPIFENKAQQLLAAARKIRERKP